MLGILQQNKEWSSCTLTKDPNFEFKNWKKKLEYGFFKKILMHNNFRQTNAINMKLFIEALCWDYYKQIKKFGSHTIHQIP